MIRRGLTGTEPGTCGKIIANQHHTIYDQKTENLWGLNEIPGNANMERARTKHRLNGPNRNEGTRPIQIQRATPTQRSYQSPRTLKRQKLDRTGMG